MLEDGAQTHFTGNQEQEELVSTGARAEIKTQQFNVLHSNFQTLTAPLQFLQEAMRSITRR